MESFKKFFKKVNPDADYDEDQLKAGEEVEKEHTTNKEVAKTIAKAHLDEFPDYYKKLKKMEKEMEK